MMKRISALALGLMLAGSVVAGVPLQSSGDMNGMMDCCKRAQVQMDSPEVTAARLCCLINCAQPAQTEAMVPAGASVPAPAPVHPASTGLHLTKLRFSPSTDSTDPHADLAQPSYILNLALLI